MQQCSCKLFHLLVSIFFLLFLRLSSCFLLAFCFFPSCVLLLSSLRHASCLLLLASYSWIFFFSPIVITFSFICSQGAIIHGLVVATLMKKWLYLLRKLASRFSTYDNKRTTYIFSFFFLSFLLLLVIKSRRETYSCAWAVFRNEADTRHRGTSLQSMAWGQKQ